MPHSAGRVFRRQARVSLLHVRVDMNQSPDRFLLRDQLDLLRPGTIRKPIENFLDDLARPNLELRKDNMYLKRGTF
jgi:hypothetical protein